MLRAAVAASVVAAAAGQQAIVQLDSWADNSCRVRFAPAGGQITSSPFSALLPTAPPVGSAVSRVGSTLVTGNLQVEVTAAGTIVATRVSDGAVLLRQTQLTYGAPPAGTGFNSMSALLSFAGVNGTERLVGFGEQQDGVVAKPLPFSRSFEAAEYYPFNHGSQALIPFYMSSAGYAFLWNMPTYGYVDVSQGGVNWYANATQNGLVDVWISTTPADMAAGTSPLAPLLKQYADAVGHAPPLPPWATGFIQSKDRYRNQTQLLEVARGYATRGLPISTIVVDWFHWKVLGDMSWNPLCWPDPQGMVNELSSLGIELMATFWPFVNDSSTHWAQFAANKWMALNRSSGQPDQFWGCASCQNSYGSLIDATQDAVREAVFDAWWESYGSLGIRSVWLDETEPDREGYTYGEWQLGGGADYEVGVAWKQQWLRTFSDGMAAHGVGPGEFFVLSRSAWAGTARYGNTLWSGDLSSTWAELQLQIAAGQGAGLSGQGTWTTDTGGYTGGNPADPAFQELLVRWFQFSAFSPIMRLHGHRDGGPPADECGGTNGDNEVYNLVPEGGPLYAAITAVMRLREGLRNYVAQVNAEFVATGMPMMRAMLLAWPADGGCQGADVEDQFMFGPDWLVAPVYAAGVPSRTVYLPSLAGTNATWTYWFNQTSYGQGGARVTVPTPIDEFPLFKLTFASSA